jgi:hypothetical protein
LGLNALQEFSYRIHLIGHPGVGKTVFSLAAYTRAREVLRTLGRSSLGLSCADPTTKEFVETSTYLMRHSGRYPASSIRPTSLYFQLYNLHSNASFWSEKTIHLCNFTCQDLPIGQGDPMLSAAGSFVFVDASALLQVPTYQNRFFTILRTLQMFTDLLQESKHSFAIVLTKCDLLELTTECRRALRNALSPLTSMLERSNQPYRTFYSSLALGAVPNTESHFLLIGDSASALLWLFDQIHPLNRAPLRVNIPALLSAM